MPHRRALTLAPLAVLVIALAGCSASGRGSDLDRQSTVLTRCDQVAAEVFLYEHRAVVTGIEFGEVVDDSIIALVPYEVQTATGATTSTTVRCEVAGVNDFDTSTATSFLVDGKEFVTS